MNILIDIYEFFSANANFALFIATLLLVIVTFLYVLYTRRMADTMVKQAAETKRMADIMTKEFELKVSSIVEAIVNRRQHTVQGFSIGVEVYNRGFYPVFLKEVILDWWYIKDKKIGDSIHSKQINKFLSPKEPITISLDFGDDQLQKEEFRESKELNSSQLGRITAGIIYAVYKDDFRNSPQRSIEVSLEHLPS